MAAAGCHTYKPLPFPPKKAAEVAVRAVADVSDAASTGFELYLSTRYSPMLTRHVQPNRHKNPKIDDDDGHFIVVPDVMVTDRCALSPITNMIYQSLCSHVCQIK